jgi:hypothetical protein
MNFSPEDSAFLEYALGAGNYNEQDRAIQQQLAQAMALRNRPQPQHTTGAGALMGGIGNIIQQATSYGQEGKLRQQDQALQSQRTQQMQALISALRGQQPAQQGVPPGIANPNPAYGAGY